MSEVAYNSYGDVEKAQHDRNEARRIRTRVDEARRSPHTAGLRWPFELLQNAIDAGPRPGKKNVAIRLACEAKRVIFDHDGAPFSLQELAALVSGGSSKEFESHDTTGRFGTGFLVTHVLARQTNLRGLLSVNGTHEMFDLALDRGGDEKEILENIHRCRNAIRSATVTADIEKVSSACFSYAVDGDETLKLGFEAFKLALPYLYGTRKQLGEVHVSPPNGKMEKWNPTGSKDYSFDGAWVQERDIQVVTADGKVAHELRVIRVSSESEYNAATVVVLERIADKWQVRIPDPAVPRAFRDYPVRNATFLPINFVIDGKFNVDQERSKILMDDSDKELIRKALKSCVAALNLACKDDWCSRHWLAKAVRPASGFEHENVAERQWWAEALREFAGGAAALPIVETSSGALPALSTGDGNVADFVLPRLLPTSAGDETTVSRLWPLIEAARDFDPPVLSLAEDWTFLAEGWSGLGLRVNRVCVKELGAAVKKEVKRADELRVDIPGVEWLARFIDIVGECWQLRNGVDQSVLEGLLPNQNGVLCPMKALHRDAEVPKKIKDICLGVGLDLRAILLTRELADVAETGKMSFVTATLAKAIPPEMNEELAVEQCIIQMEKTLPIEEKFSDKHRDGLEGCIQLVSYLQTSRAEKGSSYVKRLPLVAEDLSIMRWSKERMLMAPKLKWHKDAQPFSLAYPEGRVLFERYAGVGTTCALDVVPSLVSWGICHADPMIKISTELKERRLSALAKAPSDANGFTVSGEELTQIALLQPEVLNRCQENPDEARALLGLAVCYMARQDRSWREARTVKGRKAGEERELEIRGALWIADLTIRGWVPMPGDDGKFTKAVASQATLQHLINPAWLPGNDEGIALLSQWFGFDELELRLLGTAPGDTDRRKLRDGLAKLVEIAGADPLTYEKIAREFQETQQRARNVERCRKFGLAIQEAVKGAMEARDLKLTLVDRGFDYRVDVPSEEAWKDVSFQYNVGSYFLEVKATKEGDARLTPLQAATAARESSRYVLCVVDLRDVPFERLDEAWTVADVEPLAKVLTGLGDPARATCALVNEAKAQEVGICNESALRYVVSADVWSKGCSIETWVHAIG